MSTGPYSHPKPRAASNRRRRQRSRPTPTTDSPTPDHSSPPRSPEPTPHIPRTINRPSNNRHHTIGHHRAIPHHLIRRPRHRPDHRPIHQELHRRDTRHITRLRPTAQRIPTPPTLSSGVESTTVGRQRSTASRPTSSTVSEPVDWMMNPTLSASAPAGSRGVDQVALAHAVEFGSKGPCPRSDHGPESRSVVGTNPHLTGSLIPATDRVRPTRAHGDRAGASVLVRDDLAVPACKARHVHLLRPPAGVSVYRFACRSRRWCRSPPRCQQSACPSAFASSSNEGFRIVVEPNGGGGPATAGLTLPARTSATVRTTVPSGARASSHPRNCSNMDGLTAFELHPSQR